MTRHLVYVVKFTNITNGKPDVAIFNNRSVAEGTAEVCKGTVHLYMMGEKCPTIKLSEPQKRFLLDFIRTGSSSSPGTGTGSAAWHRTASSLQEMGLVRKNSYGFAQLTWLGLAWAVTL